MGRQKKKKSSWSTAIGSLPRIFLSEGPPVRRLSLKPHTEQCIWQRLSIPNALQTNQCITNKKQLPVSGDCSDCTFNYILLYKYMGRWLMHSSSTADSVVWALLVVPLQPSCKNVVPIFLIPLELVKTKWQCMVLTILPHSVLTG